MKKFLLILILPLLLSACKMPVYTLGMSESEFLSHYKSGTTVVEKTTERSVYKRDGERSDGRPMFYYFTDAKLTRIDEGEHRPDVIIVHQ